MIPYGRQSISEVDIEAVIEVLRSDLLTQGPQVPAFEEALAKCVGADFAVAVNSATSALHIACLALELGPGDWLWTSPNSFVASSNCALYCGAQVDFVDIDPQTYNLCLQALKSKLENAKKHGRLPKVVVPVHFAGQSCDMESISALAKEFGFRILEDASHAIGATWHKHKVGSCFFSDMTVFSFHPVKIITTAEGGCVTTNDRKLARRLSVLRSHGITRDSALMSRCEEGDWYYEQQLLGYNYRMTELQAALGLSQLGRLQEFVEGRHSLAAKYDLALKDLPLVLPWQQQDSYSSFHLYVVQIMDSAPLNRRALFDKMRAEGILVNVHYIPIHMQPYYKNLGFRCGDFPNAENYYNRTLSLPLYPALCMEDQDFVISCLKRALAK
jgi:UDP-4-amino-4,6-dideoxy-N-acetyl-beta-L-altrosamine transaminase